MDPSEEELRKLCRSALRTVVNRYGWRGYWNEMEFVEEILAATQARLGQVKRRVPRERTVEQAAIHCYAHRWHTACCSNDPFDHTEALEAVRRYVYRVTVQRTALNTLIAEESAQDALMEIWRNLQGVREPGSFVGWMRQVVVNRVAKMYKQEARLPIPDEDVGEMADVADEKEPMDEIRKDQSQVEEVLRRCLQNKDREKVIVDSLLNGRSIGDIAEEMGKTPNAVSLLKHNALNRLRNCEDLQQLREMVGSDEQKEDTSHKAVRYLLRVLDSVADGISCDECRTWLPAYVEAEVSGFDVVTEYPAVKRHLDHCRECEQEYIDLLESTLQEMEEGLPDVNVPPSLQFPPPTHIHLDEYVRGLALRVAGDLNPVWLPHVQGMAASFLQRVQSLAHNQPMPQLAPAMGVDAPERSAMRLLAATYDTTRRLAGDLSDAEIEAQIQQGTLTQTLRVEAERAAVHQGLSAEDAAKFANEYVEVVCRTPSLLRDVAKQLSRSGDV